MKGLLFTAAFIFITFLAPAQGQLINFLALSPDISLTAKNVEIRDKEEFISYSYYETGELKAVKPIVNGVFEGELISYYQDGSLRRREFFKSGESLGGICFDMDGTILPYKPFMIFATLRGDQDAESFVDDYSAFIFRTKKSRQIEELKVVLNINQSGQLVGYDFLSEVDNGTKQRVAYVLRQMTNWNPAIEEGRYVPMELELTIK